MNVLNSLLISLLFLIPFSAQAVLVETAPNYTYYEGVPQLPQPGYLQTVTDPLFNTEILRVSGDPGTPVPGLSGVNWSSGASGNRHQYSKVPAWNVDGSQLYLETSSVILNGRPPFEPISRVSWLGGSGDVRWHPTDPNTMIFVGTFGIKYVNTNTGQTYMTKSFPGFEGVQLSFGFNEGNFSADGSKILVTAPDGRVFILYMADLSMGPTFQSPRDSGEWGGLISRTGRYVLFSYYENGIDNFETWDVNETTGAHSVVAMWNDGTPNHAALIAIDGIDYSVGRTERDVTINGKFYSFGVVVLRPLSSSSPNDIKVLFNEKWCSHTSATNIQNTDWAVCSYGPWIQSDYGSSRMQGEIIAVKTDGSGEVRRLLHHRSNQYSYWAQAQASVSPDAKYIIYASDWGVANGTVNAYIAETGIVGGSDPPPPPPPPQPSAPVANFNASCNELSCSFSDQSSDADGDIQSYSYAFGDGSSSSQQSPSKTYSAAGTYSVQLTVTDSGGRSNSISKSLTVTATPPPPPQPSAPVANFNASCNELSCSFSDQSSDADGDIQSYSYAFGDGSSSSQQSPSKTYSAAGTYSVQLTVTDSGGRSNSISKSVTVIAAPPPPPTGDTTDPTVFITDPVYTQENFPFATYTVRADASDNVAVAEVRFYWSHNGTDFNLFGTDTTAPYTADWLPDCETCWYVLKAIAVDTSGNTAIHDGIWILVDGAAPPPPQPSAPVANFNASCNELSCSFSDQSSDADGDIQSYSYAFGDGSSSSQQSPSKTYSAAGTYSVQLTVTDSGGRSNSISKSVTVIAAPPPPQSAPVANFNASCNELSCSFSDQSSDADGDIQSYSYAFGDGSSSSQQSPNKTYSAAGTYSVQLTVTDSGGRSNSISKSVTVIAAPPPAGEIQVSIEYVKKRRKQFFRVNWSGAVGSNVDIYLDNGFYKRTQNDGTTRIKVSNPDSLVKICEAGSARCSNSTGKSN